MAFYGTFGENNLTALSASISNTAVDVFVYDTRKDSDGGAWRKRTSHTSWYNETLNTATRGSRREFPAVAVIVAQNQLVTIYDGDDPDLPMWMHFQINQYSNGSNLSKTPTGIGHVSSSPHNSVSLSSVHMLNGYLFIGGDRETNAASVHAGWDINFISESMNEYLHYPTSASRTTKWELGGNVAERNSTQTSGHPSSRYDTSGDPDGFLSMVNDVAMTVLPNAPIDDATGLPTPTVAVACQKGVSVITDSGVIYDLTPESEPTYASIKNFMQVAFTKENGIVLTDRQTASGYSNVIYLPFYKYNQNVSDTYSNLPGSYNYTWDEKFKYESGSSLGYWKPQDTGEEWDYLTTTSDSFVVANGDNTRPLGGITRIGTYPNQLMVNRTTTDFNTGWMYGLNVATLLSDTDATNVVGGELITNGDFGTALGSEWVSGNATITIQSGEAKVTSNSGGYSSAYQAITTVIGETYTVSANVNNVSGLNGSSIYIQNGTTLGPAIAITNSIAVGNSGILKKTFTATATTTYIHLTTQSYLANEYSLFDNVSVTRGELDRSKNQLNGGLHVYGTITKSPVAGSGDTAAELVAYSGFNSSNYLFQPYNSDLNFTDKMMIMLWVKGWESSQDLLHRGPNQTRNSQTSFALYCDGGYDYRLILSSNGTSEQGFEIPRSGNLTGWQHLCFTLENGLVRGYLNGVEETLDNTTFTGTLYSGAPGLHGLWIGRGPVSGYPANASIALLRLSSSVLSPEQVKKIYEDEKMLFQDNAACTLYGSSDAVTALAYDDSNNLLHVGTSSGRSDFQGLRRINNTTTAVTTAMSASNGLVAEQ